MTHGSFNGFDLGFEVVEAESSGTENRREGEGDGIGDGAGVLRNASVLPPQCRDVPRRAELEELGFPWPPGPGNGS